jgi:hypothetical protein
MRPCLSTCRWTFKQPLQSSGTGTPRRTGTPSTSTADLTGVDLTRADLTRADLTHADLTRADLTGTDLTRARWPSSTPVPRGWQRSDRAFLVRAASDPGDAATK